MGRIILGISRDLNIPRVRINRENRETVCFKTSKAIPLLRNSNNHNLVILHFLP